MQAPVKNSGQRSRFYQLLPPLQHRRLSSQSTNVQRGTWSVDDSVNTLNELQMPPHPRRSKMPHKEVDVLEELNSKAHSARSRSHNDRLAGSADGNEQLFSKRRKFERSKKSSLGMDVLGQPAEALVLEDRDVRNHRSGIKSAGDIRDFELLPRSQPSGAEDLLRETRLEQGYPDEDTFCEHINRLRERYTASQPTRGARLNQPQFDELSRELEQGFQKGQLIAYIRRTSTAKSTQLTSLHAPFQDSVIMRTSWEEVSQKKPSRFRKILPSTLQKHLVPGSRFTHMTRAELASTILIRLWRLKNVQDGLLEGDMLLRIQRPWLSLLINHSSTPIHELSKGLGLSVET